MRAPKESLSILAAGLLGAVALAFGPIPGKWVVPDGSQIKQKPPPITNTTLAFIQNNGPDQVVLTSQGSSVTETRVLEPNGESVAFTMPAGAKNIVISDPHVNGLKAVGTLIWAQPVPPKDDVPGDPGGVGGLGD